MGRDEKMREVKVRIYHESCTCGLPPFTAKVIDCAGCLAELTAELEGK